MKIWAKTTEFSEGKYLVVRRDGTVPPWPHFVIGGYDPCARAALKAYADEAEHRGLDPAYVESIRELADDFAELAEAARGHAEATGEKGADPDAPPHRKDNPAVLAMMRGEGDLSSYGEDPSHAR